MSAPTPERPHLGETLVSARPLVEYRAMFELSEEDLRRGPILDCPGGGSSFAAEARALGADVVSVDPMYATPPVELAARALTDTDRADEFIRTNVERYVWPFFDSHDHWLALRRGGAELFAADIVENPDRYLAAELPDLPFADESFELALSSHLLFTYSDRLDFDFHAAAIAELTRVAREARAYPLVDYGARPYPRLTALRERLEELGVASDVRYVPYEFQRGANAMLVAARGTLGSAPAS